MADLDAFDLDSFDLETIDMGSASKKPSMPGQSILVNKSPAGTPTPPTPTGGLFSFGGAGKSNSGGGILDDLDSTEFGLDMLVNKTKARKSPELSTPQSSSKSTAPPSERPGFFSNLFGGAKPAQTPAAPNLTAIDLDKEIADSEIGLNSTFNRAKTMNGPSLPPFASGGGLGGFPSSATQQPIYSAPPQQQSAPAASYNPGGAGDSINMTYEEIQKAKFDLICKFERLRDKGVKVPKMFSMSSDYDEMHHEYERLVYQRKMDNSVHMQRQWLISAISGIEFLNTRYDPFDFKLDGWSSAVHEDINKYDDIFEELYEKYQGSGSMAPELRLIFMVGGSALTHHMSMAMLKGSNLPNADEILKSDPELMARFQAAQQATMKKQAPGFGGFMSGLGGLGNLFGGGGNKSSQRDDGPPLFDASSMMGGMGGMMGGGRPSNNIPDLDTIISGL
jgi:hypothetical protein